MSLLSKALGIDIKISGGKVKRAKVDWKKLGQNLLLGAAAPQLLGINIPGLTQAAEKLGLTQLLEKVGLGKVKDILGGVSKGAKGVSLWNIPGIGMSEVPQSYLGQALGNVLGSALSGLGPIGQLLGNVIGSQLGGQLGGILGLQGGAGVGGVGGGGGDLMGMLQTILGSQKMDFTPLLFLGGLGYLLGRPYEKQLKELGDVMAEAVGKMGGLTDVAMSYLPQLQAGRQAVFELLQRSLPKG